MIFNMFALYFSRTPFCHFCVVSLYVWVNTWTLSLTSRTPGGETFAMPSLTHVKQFLYGDGDSKRTLNCSNYSLHHGQSKKKKKSSIFLIDKETKKTDKNTTPLFTRSNYLGQRRLCFDTGWFVCLFVYKSIFQQHYGKDALTDFHGKARHDSRTIW